MKSNEIMIGDWVLFIYSHRIAKVIGVTNTEIKVLIGTEETDWFIPDAIIEPILLTPEILEKNGWSLDEIDGSYRHHESGLWLGGRCAPFCLLIFNKDKDISYVHELQHALKLYGIEKEIVLCI